MRTTYLIVFVGAGIGLALCDQMHVQADVLSHDAPGPFGQGWWVPLVFGVAGVAIFGGAQLFVRDRRDAPIVVPALLFAAAYAATALFSDDSPYLLAAVLWATGLARVLRDPEPSRALAFALLLAVAGPAVELAVSELGLFSYADDFAVVALWLSGLYVHGAPLALGLARRYGVTRRPASSRGSARGSRAAPPAAS